MPAANETAVPTTASSKRHHPDAPPDIIAEEPEWASGAPAAILTTATSIACRRADAWSGKCGGRA